MKARLLPTMLLIACISMAQSVETAGTNERMKQVEHLKNFHVIELRRYSIKQGEREHFAQYFESFFPEAFEQLDALAVGQFFERAKSDHFFWLRAFHDMDDRAKVNALFYYGPLWKEHKATLNAIIGDSDNVLLLRPLDPSRPIKVMPAVDPVAEPGGAHGVVIALIYPVKADAVERFAQVAATTFAKYRAAGVQEVGLLCTLEAKNNFPQLPIRSDGPFLVWLGVVEDDSALNKTFLPLHEGSRRDIEKSELLRGATEVVVLDPTKRSRLRWLPQ